MLTKFWEQNRPLILAAFYAISNDPKQDPEVRDEADRVIKTLQNRDFSLYSVALDGEIVANNFRKTAVGREVARALIDAGISNDDFRTLSADRSSGFQLLKREEEMTDGEKQYNRYRMNSEGPLPYQGQPYYVCGNWGKDNIPKFERFLARHFPRVQIRKQIDEQPVPESVVSATI